MRTYTNNSSMLIDGKRYYWRGWVTDETYALRANERRPGESVVVMYSQDPHIYGGKVQFRAGQHIWSRRDRPSDDRKWCVDCNEWITPTHPGGEFSVAQNMIHKLVNQDKQQYEEILKQGAKNLAKFHPSLIDE